MPILAIDTSTQWCSVALFLPSGHHLYRHEKVGNKASQVILNWIQDLLIEAECSLDKIDSIAVSQGPGGFTGVRLGIGVAQGLAYAQNKPLIPISSLDGMIAHQYAQDPNSFSTNQHYHVMIDARMSQIYQASYQITSRGLIQRHGDIALMNLHDIQINTNDQYFCYDMETYLASKDIDPINFQISSATPHALGIGYLASLQTDMTLFLPKNCQPLYVRDQVALTIAQRAGN
jgi:tRNA threonylcarbamoyladenosine biosynthesis protein TsaB